MPKFKSISFPDHKPVSIRFGDAELALYALFEAKRSAELRELLGCDTFDAVAKAAARRGESVHRFIRGKLERALTAAQTPLPYRGWPDGSAAATDALRAIAHGRHVMLDPFAGRAMYPAIAAQEGLTSFYCELSPGLRAMAEARLAALSIAAEHRPRIAQALRSFADSISDQAQRPKDELLVATQPHFLREFEERASKAVEKLARLRTAIDRLEPFEGNEPPDEWPVTQLLAAAVVEALPRSPGELDPVRLLRAIEAEIRVAATFVEQEPPAVPRPQLVAYDARSLTLVAPLGVDVVATHPPSLNFAFYGGALASWFLRVRRARAERSLVYDDAVEALHARKTSRALLNNVREVNDADPRMGRIAANYFLSMAAAFEAIAPHLARHGLFAVEVNDSELVGVKVHTRKHLEGLLATHGFEKREEREPFIVLRR